MTSATVPVPFRLTPLDGRLAWWASMYAVSEASLIRVTGQGGPAYVALQVSPSAAAYRRVIDGLGPRAARELRNGYYANFHHPVLYAKALRLGAERLAQLVPLTPELQRTLSVAPAAAATADIIENVVDLRLLSDSARIGTGSVYLSNLLSIVKWTGTVGPLVYMAGRFTRVWAGAAKALLTR